MRDGLLDWDCAAAIDIPDMAKALSYIRQHAAFPVSLMQNQQHTSRTDHGTKVVPSTTFFRSIRTVELLTSRACPDYSPSSIPRRTRTR